MKISNSIGLNLAQAAISVRAARDAFRRGNAPKGMDALALARNALNEVIDELAAQVAAKEKTAKTPPPISGSMA